MTTTSINVIGAGLAGSEAAWQIAKRGLKVRLYEMRPEKKTPAHHTQRPGNSPGLFFCLKSPIQARLRALRRQITDHNPAHVSLI